MNDFLPQSLNLFEPVRQKEWHEQLEEEMCSYCPAMTYQQRLMGCALCMLAGFLLSMGSTFRLVQLLKGDPTPFATMYTFGNIIAVASTCFLYGPYSQAKQMFAETRFITTCVYFTFMGFTLYLAFWGESVPGRGFLLVICILMQFLALCWYTLSYIPWAREMVGSCLKHRCLRATGLDALLLNEDSSTTTSRFSIPSIDMNSFGGNIGNGT